VLHELSPRRGSLEEAFMQLTGEAVEYHGHPATEVTA
jgi:ABC-2 type transport system ATP-binding protein